MVNNILGSQNSQQTSRSTLFTTRSRLPPDIPQVAVAAAGPLGSSGILDIQAGVEGHAVGGSLRSVYGTLSLISDGRRNRLASQEHGMNIGFAGRDDAVRDKSEKERHQAGRVDVPLPEQLGKARVEAVKDAHRRLVARSSRVRDCRALWRLG